MSDTVLNALYRLSHLIHIQNFVVGTRIISILQVRNLRLGDVK